MGPEDWLVLAGVIKKMLNDNEIKGDYNYARRRILCIILLLRYLSFSEFE